MTKEDIDKWCDRMDLYRYSINDDLTIDTNDDVDLYNLKLSELPYKFNKVLGDFNMGMNNIDTLENCPNYVDDDFNCSLTYIKDLKFSPKEVGMSFECGSCKLTSLEGVTEKIGYDFNCVDNKLTSLEYSPKWVGRDFYCGYNQIYNLDGFDCEFKGIFYCNDTPLSTLFDNVEYDFIQAFKTFKVIKDKEINLKRLKYVFDIFGMDLNKVNLDNVKTYYTVV